MRYFKSTTLPILLTIGMLSTQCFSQKTGSTETPQKVVLTRYLMTSEANVHHILGVDDDVMLAIMMQKDNNEAKKFMLNSLNIVLDTIHKSSNIQFLPIETLEGKVVYSKLGFPLASLKKAAKKSSYDKYATIEIAVVGAKRIETSSSSDVALGQAGVINLQEVADSLEVRVSETSSQLEFFPEVIITLKLGNAEGKGTTKIQGTYRHDERVSIQSLSLDFSFGLSMEQDVQAESIPYYYFLAKAAEDLVAKLP